MACRRLGDSLEEEAFFLQVREDDDKGLLPALDEKIPFKVCVMRDESLNNWVLVLTNHEGTGFSIQLDCSFDNEGSYRVKPFAKKITIDTRTNWLMYKGEVEDYGWNLINLISEVCNKILNEDGRIYGEAVEEGTIQRYKERVKSDAKAKWLPDLDAELDYEVYLMKNEESLLGLHWLLVLTSDGKTGFTIELDNRKDGEESYSAHPDTRKIIIDTNKMTHKGQVTDSGWNLIQRALKVLRGFGPYSLLENNCQKYCNKVLEELRLAQEWTDGGVMGLIAAEVIEQSKSHY